MSTDRQEAVTDSAIASALGEEIRRTREAGGWSRKQFVAGLPSGIGDRTLVSYEHGARPITVARLVELSRALGVPAPVILNQALQSAEFELQNLVLHVELRQLLTATHDRFQLLVQWARNRLIENPRGVVELTPVAVREMAALIGCSHSDLARYLADFTPP